MSHAMSPERHETYVARRKSEKARKTERKHARADKATARRLAN